MAKKRVKRPIYAHLYEPGADLMERLDLYGMGPDPATGARVKGKGRKAKRKARRRVAVERARTAQPEHPKCCSKRSERYDYL